MNNLLNNNYSRDTWINFLKNQFLPSDFSLRRELIDIDFKSNYINPQAYWIGDCESLGDMAIIEVKHSSENDPRIGVSRDAFRLMANHGLSKALFFFVSDNSNNYRFSLITLDLKLEGKDVKYNFSNPKRFSFFLGDEAKIHTPEEFLFKKGRIKNFEDMQSRFSIEVVNKEFYHEIQRLFYKLVGGKVKQGSKNFEFTPMLKLPSTTDHQIMQEFSVRLIGRLVFCWFLKKKKSIAAIPLIPENILSSNAIEREYYHNTIEPLFFELLNTPINERRSDFRTPEYDLIPFLNGGLFDPNLHEDYYRYSPMDKEYKPAYDLKIPDEWLKEFISLLETYNFTIDENTSIDIDLSVDPEMLGRIFENLLAEINPETGNTARKSTGSYYTPRPIVEYMVDESLIQYLLTKTDINETAIRELLDYNIEGTDLPKEQKIAVIDALDEIKVLDPACGSGAFPMGILQKMLLILQKVDPESIEWVIRQLDKIPNIMVRQALEEKLMNENWKYKHKMGIIQNAIYGVDIQPIATEISKLRLFLTLIVDENIIDEKANRNIHPLPNLSFKFVTANSLIGLGDEDETMLHNLKMKAKFDNIREKYFYASSIGSKKEIEIEFENLQKELVEFLTEPDVLQQNIFGGLEKSKQKKKPLKPYFYKLLNWNPFKDEPTSWFDPKWMFGIKDGFDIVIGNPPYIQLQKAFNDDIKFADLYKDESFQTFERTGDIYCLFYEKGHQILKNGGHLCFITSNKWMRAKYGKSLRRFLSDKTTPKNLIDFGGFKVFESATVDTNVIIFQNYSNHDSICKACSMQNDYKKGMVISDYLAKNHINISNLSDESWIISSPIELQIKQKIESIGIPLKDWDINIYRGVLTGFNEAFIITGDKKEELISQDPKSAEIIKPILRGRDIKRYKAEFADLWLIATLPAMNLNIDDYPAVKAHLESFLPRIKQTGETYIDKFGISHKTRKKTGNKWFETQDQIAYYEEFEKEKVVYPNMTKYRPFYFDSNNYYTNQKCFIITSPNNDLQTLTSILNSSIFDFAFKDRFPELLGGTRELSKVYFELIPIPKISPSEQSPFILLVNQILRNKELGEDTAKLENQIDLMVYKLYELTYEEAKIVDPVIDIVLSQFNLNKEAYEKMTVEELGNLEIK